MSEFDDPELERMLGRASGPFPDANTAYESVRGRVRQVKRRRAIVASTAACVMLFGGAVLAARQGGGRGGLQPGDDIAVTRTTVPTAPTDRSTVPDSTPATMVIAPGTDGPSTSTATSTSSGHGGGGPGTSPGGHGNGSGSTPGGPGTTVTSPAASTTTYHAVGGSITVRLAGGRLTLLASNPDTANGYQQESGAVTGGDRVEVKFNNGSHTSVIRVDLVHGVPQPRIDEHG